MKKAENKNAHQNRDVFGGSELGHLGETSVLWTCGPLFVSLKEGNYTKKFSFSECLDP